VILSVTVNPSVDHTLFLDGIKLGDTNRVQRTERDAGGKGVNLSRIVAELGRPTYATGFAGGGPGAYIRAVLDRQGVDHCFVVIGGETRINFSVETGDGPPTTFNERGPEISTEELETLVAKCQELAPQVEWAALGGSVPPGVPDDIFRTLGDLFRNAGCRVAIDADGEAMRSAMAARPDFIKPNENEAERLLGRPVRDRDAAVSAANELLDALGRGGGRIVVISRGAKGAVMACDAGTFDGRSPKVEVRSTIGSGDSMVAGMLWAIQEGHPLEEAFRWGLAAGAATATTGGSEIARRPMIQELFPHTTVEAASF
jgi:1-phosphofructokinase